MRQQFYRGATIIAAGLLIAGCAPRTATQTDLGEVVSQPMPAIVSTTVSDIANDPQQYLAKMVTVSGEVGRVFGPRWFTIGGKDFGGKEILVLGPSAAPSILNTLADSAKVMNDIVQVTGVVRIFEEDALEREVGGGLDLDGDVFDAFDANPVIVMSELDITPRVDVTPVVVVPVPVAPIIDEIIIVDAPDRASLVGRSVALLDARVQRVLSNRAFLIGPSATRQLLVVLDSAAAARHSSLISKVRVGQHIAVAGVIQPVAPHLATLRSMWGLSAADEAAVAREPIYLSANTVAILER